LLFLEWIAERAEAEFLLKTDDDEPWQFGSVSSAVMVGGRDGEQLHGGDC